MANQIPSNIYAGAAVHLNPNAYAQQYLNMLAHQQAMRDATRKYLGTLGTRITPKGLASEDAAKLIQMKNEWQQHSIQNQRQIANPNIDGGQAYMENMQRVNAMQDLIDRGQYKTQMLNYAKTVLNSPQKHNLLTDDAKNNIALGSLPVTDPNYRELNQGDIQFKNKPFDENDFHKILPFLPQGTPTQDIKNATTDLTTRKKTIPVHTVFGDNDINGHRALASHLLNTDEGFKDQVDNLTPNSPDFQRINQTWQTQTGKPLDPTNPIDVGAAYLLDQNPNRYKAFQAKVENIPVSPQETQQAILNRQLAFYNYTGKHPKSSMSSTPNPIVSNYFQKMQSSGDVLNPYDPTGVSTIKERSLNTGESKEFGKLYYPTDQNGNQSGQPLVVPAEKIQYTPNGANVFYSDGTQKTMTHYEAALHQAKADGVGTQKDKATFTTGYNPDLTPRVVAPSNGAVVPTASPAVKTTTHPIGVLDTPPSPPPPSTSTPNQ
jgi:hypothetical protein